MKEKKKIIVRNFNDTFPFINDLALSEVMDAKRIEKIHKVWLGILSLNECNEYLELSLGEEMRTRKFFLKSFLGLLSSV